MSTVYNLLPFIPNTYQTTHTLLRHIYVCIIYKEDTYNNYSVYSPLNHSLGALWWYQRWIDMDEKLTLSSNASTFRFWKLIAVFFRSPSNPLLFIVVDHHLILHWYVLQKPKTKGTKGGFQFWMFDIIMFMVVLNMYQ